MTPVADRGAAGKLQRNCGKAHKIDAQGGEQTLADLGAIYLLILGAVAVIVMLKAPKGLWGLVADRCGWQLFPLERRLVTSGKQQS